MESKDDNYTCIRTMVKNSLMVWNVAFSPDGQFLASCSLDGTVKLWNVQSGQCTKTMKKKNTRLFQAVYGIAFSPDGKYLTSCNDDFTVKLWLIETGECTRTMEGHIDDVSSVTFSPDGQYLVSYTKYNVKLWLVETGECTWEKKYNHNEYINCISFSPDGQYLASLSYYEKYDDYKGWVKTSLVKLLNVENGECKMTTEGGYDHIAFFPDGKYLTLDSTGKTVKLWKPIKLIGIEQGRKIIYTFLTCLLRNCNKGKLPDTIYHGFNSIGPSNIILQMLLSYDQKF